MSLDISFSGMCKHVHVAFNVARMKELDIEHARMRHAEELFSGGLYAQYGDEILIFDDDNYVNTVNGMNCTCIAASHGVRCACKMVVDLIMNDVPTAPEVIEEATAEMPCESVPIDPKRIAIQKVDEIRSWLLGSTCDDASHLKEVCDNISRLHTLTFRTKFTKVTSKRKIGPNSLCRRSIELAKKRKLAGDHRYTGTSGKQVKRQVNKDGSFKRTHRAKLTERKSFQ